MARDNRKENRAKGKAEAENENKAPDGTDFSDLMGNQENEEELSDGMDDDNENEDENEGKEKEEGKEKNADKSEEGEKRVKEKEGKDATLDDLSGTKSVDNDDEEEVKKAEDETDKSKSEKKADEKSEDEKKADDEGKEKKVEEPTEKTVPPSEEKKEDQKAKAEELTDEQATELFTNWRAETQNILAEHVYKLTEDDVAELNENPAAYIPKMAARVYLDSISAAFQQFVTYLPRMVHQVLEAREGISVQEAAFYKEWPELAAHKDKVLRMGAAYRKENPSASQEDFINEVGAQAMVALRLSPVKKNGAGAEEAAKTTTKENKGFKPATAGGASSTPPEKKPQNPFDEMASEWGSQGEELDDS